MMPPGEDALEYIGGVEERQSVSLCVTNDGSVYGLTDQPALRPPGASGYGRQRPALLFGQIDLRSLHGTSDASSRLSLSQDIFDFRKQDGELGLDGVPH